MAISTHMMGTVSSNKYYIEDPESEYLRRQLIEMQRAYGQSDEAIKDIDSLRNAYKAAEAKPVQPKPNLTLLLCEDI